jgi:hypothetical protein
MGQSYYGWYVVLDFGEYNDYGIENMIVLSLVKISRNVFNY